MTLSDRIPYQAQIDRPKADASGGKKACGMELSSMSRNGGSRTPCLARC